MKNSFMILITGMEGFLAGRFIGKFSDSFEIKYTSLTRNSDWKCEYLDLSRPDEFNYEILDKTSLVLHLASISSPDICEKQYEFAYKLNVDGSRHFIKKCLEKKARVLFFSSDTIYGPSEKVADENSCPNPAGEYAIMKRLVENEFIGNRNFKIFRMSYVFARNDKFTAYLESCSQNKTIAEIFHPIKRNIVYINDVLDAAIILRNKWDMFNNPVFNICGSELLSRIDMAELYKKNVDSNLQFTIIQPSENFFKARPKTINTKSLFLDKLLNRAPEKIEQAMRIEFGK